MLHFKKYPIQAALLNPLKLQSSPCSGEDLKQGKEGEANRESCYLMHHIYYIKMFLKKFVSWSVYCL